MNATADFYTKNFNDYSVLLLSLKRKLHWYGWYRFIVFLLIFVPFISVGFTPASGSIAFILLVLFLFLIKKNSELEKEKKRATVLLQLVENEKLALQHSFLHFANGKEYLNPEHFFSYDLDVFGEGSLFQFLNRTSTSGGKECLASWLENPLKNKAEIENRQEAVKELAKLREWRLKYLTEGKLFQETKIMNEEIRSWSELSLSFKRSAITRYLIWIIPLLTVLAAIPAITGFSNLFLYLMLLTQWLTLFSFWKTVTHYFRFFGRKSELLSKYKLLLQLIDKSHFQAALLKEYQKNIKDPSAAKAFRELKSLVKEFEYRQNILVGFFLNSVFLWDVRCSLRLWSWHNTYHSRLCVWLDAIAEIDTLISLANFSDNHPEYIFPEVEENDFEFACTGLGHPLLHPKKRICNNLELNHWSQVLIVTGANMAGKSTFLRTIGVNLVLAKMGAPVCADSMRFTPVDLYTNMRTTDSLLKDESYFFAELRRIKMVLDHLRAGEKYFVILDEMLKGTNSVDKLNGSKELIRKLVHLQAVSLIATHDLKLSEMENEFPEQVSNMCFEIQIVNDELVFDYKLSDGITQTMNATFLMKKMGII